MKERIIVILFLAMSMFLLACEEKMSSEDFSSEDCTNEDFEDISKKILWKLQM